MLDLFVIVFTMIFRINALDYRVIDLDIIGLKIIMIDRCVFLIR